MTLAWEPSRNRVAQIASPTIIFLWAHHSGATGIYDLSGSGLLSASNQYVGYSGTGTFTQSGGTNSVYYNLYLGYDSGASGTYNLGDTALLSCAVDDEVVGYGGTGTFTQSGGTNTINNQFSFLAGNPAPTAHTT